VCRRWFADDRVLACIRIRSIDYIGIQDVVDRLQTSATVKARLPKTSRHIKVSDLRAQAEKLIADRMMPDLDKLLDVVAQIRTKYQPKILEARRQARIHVVRRTLRALTPRPLPMAEALQVWDAATASEKAELAQEFVRKKNLYMQRAYRRRFCKSLISFWFLYSNQSYCAAPILG
jgi:hypothetical protein